MPKKHKSGGKKHTPTKKFNHRSLNDSFATPSASSSASPRPYFSLADEVKNTERHHEAWTPAKRLRDQPVAFVSAGTIGPLEDPKTEDPVTIQPEDSLKLDIDDNLEPDDDDQEDDGPELELDDGMEHLDDSDGALAQMTIDSVDTTPIEAAADIAGNVEMSVEEDTHQEPQPPIPEPSTEEPPSSLFFVDTQGDDHLAFKGQKSAFVPRPASPTPSDSSEEVVFRGRGVVVRHDSSNPPPPRTQPPLAEEPVDALLRAIDEQEVLSNVPAPTSELVKEESTSAKQPAWPTRNPKPRLDQHFSAVKPQSRKSKKARKKQNKLMREELDPDDELLQDYIDNMDPEERASFGLFANDQDSADHLFNQLLDQDDPDDKLNPDTIPGVDTSSGSDSWHTDNGEDEDDDDDDDDDESDHLDDLDSSDLESELEYQEREQWEDEADLRQRQRDAMTDEEIAHLLAKQEAYGMGGDEMLLFDDSGFGDLDAARSALDQFSGAFSMASRSRNKKGTRKGKKNDRFPDASLMADVLEQDPYGGFDVMDFDRPSLKPKSKGRKSAGILPEELGLSDEELIADLQSAWANDRSKKASRKAEREELRALGLLGSQKKNGKGNKFKPDMSARYEEGISMSQVRSELREFLDSEEWSTKHFPPMLKQDRKVLHEIANHFNLKSKSVGSGKNRAPVLIKTSRTLDWDETHFVRVQTIVQRGFFRQPGKKVKTREFAADKMKKRSGGGGAAGLANGQIVGADAPEIGASNFGRKLMEKMGWQAGMALGKEGSTGLLVPVEARIKSGKGGLG